MAIKIVTPENLSYFKTKQDAANETKFALKGHKHNAADINSGVLAIANGGTGASTPAAASEALSKFRYAVQLTNENLNDYATSQLGTYYAADGNTCTNKPSDVDGFGMMVIRSNTGHATQILYCNGTQYIRNYDGSAWGTWSTAETSDHKHDAADITSGTFSSDRLPTVPVSKGGTGATDAAGARANLLVPSYGSGISSLNFYSDVSNGYNFVADARTGSGEGYYSYFGNRFLGLRRYTNNGSSQEDVWLLRPNDAIGGVFKSGRGIIHDLSRDALYNLAPGTYLVYNDATNGPESGNYGNLLVSYSDGNRIVGLLAYDNGHIYTTYGASSVATFGWVKVSNGGHVGYILWTGSAGNGGTVSLSLSVLKMYSLALVYTSWSTTFAVPCAVATDSSGVHLVGSVDAVFQNANNAAHIMVNLCQSGSSLKGYARAAEFSQNWDGNWSAQNITKIVGVV